MDTGHVIEKIQLTVLPVLVNFGSRLLGAIALWVCGRLVIRLVRRMIQKACSSRRLDSMLMSYLDSVTDIGLQGLLLVAVLSLFGVETATFAGMLAAAGVAIGMAWSGLLANFAAGVFLVLLRPLKVGDFVSTGGVTGTVQEVGLIVTCIDTLNNVRIYVGNSKIFAGTIQNWSSHPYIRIDLSAPLPHHIDPEDAMEHLRLRLATVPLVARDPAPSVGSLNFTLAGPVLAVRIFARIDDFSGATFAANHAISNEFAKAGYPIPATPHIHHQPLPSTRAATIGSEHIAQSIRWARRVQTADCLFRPNFGCSSSAADSWLPAHRGVDSLH